MPNSEENFFQTLHADPARARDEIIGTDDPFSMKGAIRPVERSNEWMPPALHLLAPDEFSEILLLGSFISRALVELMGGAENGSVEIPSPQIVAMDIAVLHLQRPQHLHAWSNADPLAKIAAYVELARRIHRPSCRVIGGPFQFDIIGASARWTPRIMTHADRAAVAADLHAMSAPLEKRGLLERIREAIRLRH